jgi:dTDP-4-amino-4,6-dideoxygalactose transaminase
MLKRALRFLEWSASVRPLLRSVFLGGVEGLPQPLAQRFNAAWAAYCGTAHCVLVAHGTDALRIGLASALDHDGLDYGGEVIVPNLSFIASATAALDRRFGVCLVDVDPATLLLDPRRVEEAIVPGKTRAILPVHLYGQPADMTALRAIADRHGLAIVEDAAQAHGASWESRPVGSLGDAGAFSFQSSKVLSSGEGGALVTSDEELFERAHAMQNVGRDRRKPKRWGHATLGWNFRITEYQAALLLHRLKRLDRERERRAESSALLREALSDATCVEPLALPPQVTGHARYMFTMRFRPERCGGISADEFVQRARGEGIPLHRGFQSTIAEQPAIRTLIERRPSYFTCPGTPVADDAVRRLVHFSHPFLLGSPGEMRKAADGIRRVMAKSESNRPLRA